MNPETNNIHAINSCYGDDYFQLYISTVRAAIKKKKTA